MTTDAYHVTSPHPEGEGMVRAMAAALESGRIAPAAVGYVNAHGTATPQNDRIEARAIHEVFGPGRLLVSSTKSMIGHTMAAAGAPEAGAALPPPVHHGGPADVVLAAPGPHPAFDRRPPRGP